MIAGPTPPGPLRDLAVNLIGALDGPMSGWLGLTRVDAGNALRQVRSADPRLLVFTTGDGPVPDLTRLADAVCSWCARNDGERDQPAVSFGADGVTVRVRSDVTQSPQRLAEFVEFGLACHTALSGRPSQREVT